MPRADVAREASFVHAAVYGPPKSGKTFAVAALAKHYNIIWIDAENGAGTLYNPQLGLTQEDLSHITLISLRDNAAYPIAIETVYALFSPRLWKFPVTVCAAHGKINCPVCKAANAVVDEVALGNLGRDTIVVLDSMTQLAASALCVAKGGKADIVSATQSAPNLLTLKPATAFVKADFDVWAAQGGMLGAVLAAAQTAPFHLIFITHEQEVEQEDGKDRLVPAGGTRNFSRSLARHFSDVIVMGVRAGKHVAGSSSTYMPNTLTGSRSGVATEKLDAKESLLALFSEYRNHKPVA